jgi:carbon storage regulator CsrA
MLVLSRKENEEILFPNLGINVRITRIEGKNVRIGIEAPKDVSILRGELASGSEDLQPKASSAEKISHQVRNQLNSIQLALYLMQKQIDAERYDQVDRTLGRALDALAALDQQVAPATTPTKQRRKLRALVVEDCDNERELLAGLLEMHGYQVETAADGKDAIDFLAEHHAPDLVLLDMNMPRMNGREAADAIRNDPRFGRLKIFAVSGSDPQDFRGREGSIDRWFQKPLKPGDFAAQLEKELAPSAAMWH